MTKLLGKLGCVLVEWLISILSALVMFFPSLHLPLPQKKLLA